MAKKTPQSTESYALQTKALESGAKIASAAVSNPVLSLIGGIVICEQLEKMGVLSNNMATGIEVALLAKEGSAALLGGSGFITSHLGSLGLLGNKLF